MIKVLTGVIVCLWASASALAQPVMLDPNLSVRELVSGLSVPTTMAFIGPDDILVLQKNDGKVRRVIAGVLQPGEVLDLNVDAQSERGLLGIAVHPSFPATPFVYLYFTERNSGDGFGGGVANRVYRYSWNGSVLATPATLIAGLPLTPGPNHDGGVITFGPDGKLYIVIGDLNRNGRLQNNPSGAAPDDTSVILRLNDDGTTPNDNPFFAQGGNVTRYFAYGIRNSFGMAFDPVTNKLWMTENGPAQFDEINLVERGFNSGWNQIMGPDGRNAAGVANLYSLPRSRYADPKFAWLETIGVTGIAFLGSEQFGPEYENNAFVGDVNNGNLYRFVLNKARNGFILSDGLADKVADSVNERNDLRVGMDFNGITDLKVGPDGLLYVVSIGDGAIYVIQPTIVVGTSAVPDGEAGVPYNADLNISGGTAPYEVTVMNGSLPAGLIIANGVITGAPAQTKKSSFSLQITDQSGAWATRSFRMRVYPALTIVTKNLRKGRVGRKYLADLASGKGKKPHTWSLVAGTLPDGLALDPPTGRITGTPTTAGVATLTFQVTDSLGAGIQKTFTLTVQ
jgi:glucose/arabinose dehydrogenase